MKICSKRIYLPFIGLLLAILFAGIAKAETIVFGEDFQGTPIRIVGDRDYPPIEWLENGQIKGIYSDFLAELSNKMRRPIAYTLKEWAQAQNDVLQGDADVLTVFSPNQERIKHYSFIKGFIKLDISIFTRDSNFDFSNLSDLDNHTLGVIKGSYPATVLPPRTTATIVTVRNHLEGFRMIKGGSLDALVTTKWVGAYLLNKEGIRGIKIVQNPIMSKGTHMAVKKGNEDLLAELTNGIKDMASEGDVSRIKAKWADYYMVYLTEKEVKNALLIGIIVCMLILISALILWAFSLKKKLAQRKERDRLEYLADYDEITGLPNKRLLIRRLDSAFYQLGEGTQLSLAVLTIDLDNFKRINDSLGIEVGDSITKLIADRIKQVIKEHDTLCKITGDKFVVILEPEYQISARATQLAFRVLKVVAKKIQIEKNEAHCTVSIGIAVAPHDGKTPTEILQKADVAVNYAKKNGGNNFQFYESALTKAATDRLLMENSLNTAIENTEFLLFYQPQYALKTEEIHSVEALIRWKGKDGEYIPPSKFIPIAEETGQISNIDSWVLSEACKQLSLWLQKEINIKLSVNISAVKLQSEAFVTQVSQALQRYQIPPKYLTIEITETALMRDEIKSLERIKELKKLGVSISLDDFGTGYSSLSLLKKISANELKIDRSFVAGLPKDADDMSICSSLIAVAHNLGIEVVAEGVEEIAQVNALAELGCDYTQGYFYSPAVSAQEIEEIVLGSM